MKIQIASDLHLEQWRLNLPDPARHFASDESRDLLILAGDIMDSRTEYGLPFIRRELDISPVIYVPGNHEYYYASKQKVDDWWRTSARYHTELHYLNDETVDIGGLRFYGAEWCSDFWGQPPIHFHMAVHDFRYTWDWDTYAHLEEHKRITASIEALAGKVDVVITHFPPTLEAIDQELYAGDKNNPYFINDAEPLVQYVGAKLWVSGHTHSPFDYRVGQTRVIGNPRGYPGEDPRPGFSVMKTVEV